MPDHWLLTAIQLLWWVAAVVVDSWAMIGIKRAWEHNEDWPNHVAFVEVWQEHFKREVAAGWTFYDGVGH